MTRFAVRVRVGTCCQYLVSISVHDNSANTARTQHKENECKGRAPSLSSLPPLSDIPMTQLAASSRVCLQSESTRARRCSHSLSGGPPL